MGKTQTLQIKGIAIVLMLIHHIVLFSPDYINWGHIDILGGFGKICVSIFCFLSGYGLMKSNPDGMEFSTKKFLVKRIISLYSPYWFIWLVFIPWFTLLVNGSFMEAWTANVTPTKTIGWANPIYLLLLDLLGVSKNFGFHNFIGVAWFFGCIIPLYLVFPLIKNTYQNHRLVYWAISVIMMMLWFVARYYSIWIPLIEPFMPYFISFLLGVAMSDDRVMKAGLNKDSGIKPIYLYTIVIVTLVILFLFRLHIHWPYFLTLEWVLIGGVSGCMSIYYTEEFLLSDMFLRS